MPWKRSTPLKKTLNVISLLRNGLPSSLAELPAPVPGWAAGSGSFGSKDCLPQMAAALHRAGAQVSAEPWAHQHHSTASFLQTIMLLNTQPKGVSNSWALGGLERQPSEQEQCRAHQAASSSYCTELIPQGAHSPWHSPFSGVAHGAFMGEKPGRCKSQVPRAWMLFLLSTASSGIWLHGWLLAQHSQGALAWALWGSGGSVCLWTATKNPLTLSLSKGKRTKTGFCPNPVPTSFLRCAQHRPGSVPPQLRQDTSAPSFPNSIHRGFRSDRNVKISVCQDGDTLPAAGQRQAQGCVTFTSAYTRCTGRACSSVFAWLTMSLMYIYTFIYAARFLNIHMVLHVFWKLEFLTWRYLESRGGMQRLTDISELDTLLENAHNCKRF